MAYPYTWLEPYKAVTDFLLTQEGEQKKLITILQDLGIKGFKDGVSESGEELFLEEIDPFTFMAYLNKFNDSNRIKFLNELLDVLKLTCHKAREVFGVPTLLGTNMHFFPHRAARNSDDIKNLWELFYQAKDNRIDPKLYSKVLDIADVGTVKLSIGLFYTNPKHFIPLDHYARNMLKVSGYMPLESVSDGNDGSGALRSGSGRQMEFDECFADFNKYKLLCQKVCDELECTPYEFSFEAFAKMNKVFSPFRELQAD